MAGAKGFGLNRIPTTIGNVGITASIQPGLGTQTVNGLDGKTGIDVVTDPAYLLGTGSVLYGSIHLGDTIIPVSAFADTQALPGVPDGSISLLTLSKMMAFGSNDEVRAVVSADIDNYLLAETKGAVITTRVADLATWSAPGDAGQADAGVGADPLYAYVVTSIDGVLIVASGTNQPAITLDLVQIEAGPVETVLWSRQFAYGVAAGNQGYTQSVSLTGLNIGIVANAGVTLRFSAAAEIGASQSAAITYNRLSAV